jgi:hypothetical protein
MGEPTPTSVYWKDDNVKDEGLNLKMEKQNYTLPRYMYQESVLSRIISLKHFLFCAELKIKLIFHNNLQPYTNQDGDECGILF